MRAAIWNGPGSDGRSAPSPTRCAPRTACCCACSRAASAAPTCASFFNGDRRIEAPWVLGHEISGEVIEIGPRRRDDRASGIAVGDAVHCISTLWCGRCRLCRGGNEHLCLQRRADGLRLSRAPTPSAWRSPRSRCKNLFRIPDGLSPAHATFADPLSDAICGHKDIGDRPRQTRRRDRRRPGRHRALRAGPRCRAPARCCCSRRAAQPARRSRDGDRSATTAWPTSTPSGDDGIAAVRTATDDFGADVVIVACSSDMAQEQAMEMAAPRGRVLFFGGLPKGTTHMRVPVERPALPGGAGARLVRVAPPRPGAGARHAGRATRAASARGRREVIPLDEAPDAFDRDPRRRGAEGRRRAVTAPSALRHGLAQELRTRDPSAGESRARRAAAVGARAGAAARRLALVAARGDHAARGGGPRAARARLGHLRHAPAAAAQQPRSATSASPRDRVVRPGARHARAERVARRARAGLGRGGARRRAGARRAAARAHRRRPAGRRTRSTDVPARATPVDGELALRGACGAAAIHHGVATLRPVTADRDPGRALGVAEGAPLLELRQVDYDEPTAGGRGRAGAPRGRRVRLHGLPRGARR